MRSIKLPSWIETSLGLDPLASPPDVFLLTARHLSYAKISEKNGVWEVSEYHSTELPFETFHRGILGGPVKDLSGFTQLVIDFVRGLSTPVHQASIILPDQWLRVAFTEAENLPKAPDQRDEVLRFKLKRVIPFRIEELRIRGSQVARLPSQDEGSRWLLGFGIEELLHGIDTAFEAAKVHLGAMTNQTLGIRESLAQSFEDVGLGALVVAHSNGYTQCFLQGGEPVLFRYKALDFRLPAAQLERVVRRDLRLTKGFMRDHFPRLDMGRLVFVGPAEVEETWSHWASEELEHRVDNAAGLAPAIRVQQPTLYWPELLAMLGASMKEIR